MVISLCCMSFSETYNEIFKMVVPAEVVWRLKTLIFLFAISPFVAFNFSFSRVELYFDTFKLTTKAGHITGFRTLSEHLWKRLLETVTLLKKIENRMTNSIITFQNSIPIQFWNLSRICPEGTAFLGHPSMMAFFDFFFAEFMQWPYAITAAAAVQILEKN